MYQSATLAGSMATSALCSASGRAIRATRGTEGRGVEGRIRLWRRWTVSVPLSAGAGTAAVAPPSSMSNSPSAEAGAALAAIKRRPATAASRNLMLAPRKQDRLATARCEASDKIALTEDSQSSRDRRSTHSVPNPNTSMIAMPNQKPEGCCCQGRPPRFMPKIPVTSVIGRKIVVTIDRM